MTDKAFLGLVLNLSIGDLRSGNSGLISMPLAGSASIGALRSLLRRLSGLSTARFHVNQRSQSRLAKAYSSCNRCSRIGPFHLRQLRSGDRRSYLSSATP